MIIWSIVSFRGIHRFAELILNDILYVKKLVLLNMEGNNRQKGIVRGQSSRLVPRN